MELGQQTDVIIMAFTKALDKLVHKLRGLGVNTWTTNFVTSSLSTQGCCCDSLKQRTP